MIPLRDYNPSRTFPLVTVTLIVLNILLFLYDRATGFDTLVTLQTPRGPLTVPQFVGGLTETWALVPARFVAAPSLQWPTLFSSMFLHGNWLHIVSNMLYLWIFGDNIEDTLGRGKFIAFYLAAGAAAAFSQILSQPLASVPMVGASGAVAGVMGAYIILFPQARVLTVVPIIIIATLMEVPAYLIIGYWALLQFISAEWVDGKDISSLGGVAYFAHIGGFLAGVVMILIHGKGRRTR